MTMPPKYLGRTPNIHQDASVFHVLTRLTSLRRRVAKVWEGARRSHVHASELAFWPRNSAEDIWNGLAQAVPSSQNTAVFIESTANGVSGVFYDLWKGAIEGTNGFHPFLSRGS